MRVGTWLTVGIVGVLGHACAPGQAADPGEAAESRRPTFELTTTEAYDVGSITPYAGSHDQVYAYVDAHVDEHLGNLQRWLRQPSISAQNVGIAEMAEMVRADLAALGFTETAVVPTSGHPGVWAVYDAGAPRTLAVYLMYDVQPVNPQDWESPPFAAELVDKPMGKVLMARGLPTRRDRRSRC